MCLLSFTRIFNMARLGLAGSRLGSSLTIGCILGITSLGLIQGATITYLTIALYPYFIHGVYQLFTGF